MNKFCASHPLLILKIVQNSIQLMQGSLNYYRLRSPQDIQIYLYSMKNTHKRSDYDSSEEEDEVNVDYFDRLQKNKGCSSMDKIKPLLRAKQIYDVEEPEQDLEFKLKPRLTQDAGSGGKIIANVSSVSQSSQYVNKRPLTATYTFKLKNQPCKRKRHDPVSLFQQTSQAWKKDRFLTSRADNKEGRKLDLDKRNKELHKI